MSTNIYSTLLPCYYVEVKMVQLLRADDFLSVKIILDSETRWAARWSSSQFQASSDSGRRWRCDQAIAADADFISVLSIDETFILLGLKILVLRWNSLSLVSIQSPDLVCEINWLVKKVISVFLGLPIIIMAGLPMKIIIIIWSTDFSKTSLSVFAFIFAR